MKKQLLSVFIVCGMHCSYVVGASVFDDVWNRVEKLSESCALLDVYSSSAMPSSSVQFGASRAELAIREAINLINYIASVNGLSDIYRRGFVARAFRYYQQVLAFKSTVMFRSCLYR